MKHIEYNTCGTCSKQIIIDLDDNNVVRSCSFVGGCHGNTQGIGRLVCGLGAEEVIARLKGIKCGSKGTSCPDQLAAALIMAIEKPETE
ncbi:MAG: TIGR03905 family TSCPD domain-containing protein [Bacteroidales bacterium]|nr:TIGR03905 family TSCPD domain-containing protein [Bacteroidales bacterium]